MTVRRFPISGKLTRFFGWVFLVDQVQAFFIALAIVGGIGFLTMFGWLMLFGG